MTNDYFSVSDQAFKLRELIQSAVPAAPAPPVGLPMIVVSGARAGVGATTVAVNLAAVLSDGGACVVLVDAAGAEADLAEAAGVASRIKKSVVDVVDGHCRAAEALVRGPAGIMILAGRGRDGRRGNESEFRRNSAMKNGSDLSRHAQQRLLAELQTLENQASLLVVDAGAGLTPWARRFWLRAALVILVTTAEDRALLDAYAAVKRSALDPIPGDLRVLANRCDSERIATGACQRLSAACERFLSQPVPALPALLRHCPTESAGKSIIPRVWEDPDSPFGHAMLWLGRAVCDVVGSEQITEAHASFT